LSNIDKHRLLHVTHSSLEGSQFRLVSQEPIVFRGYEFLPGPLKKNAVIARWHVTPGFGRPFNMHVDAELVTDITFGKGNPARSVQGEGVIATLHRISTFIASDVLPPLAAELGLVSTFTPRRLIDVLSATPEELSEIRAGNSFGVRHFRAPAEMD
jgi:hypothetical protein